MSNAADEPLSRIAVFGGTFDPIHDAHLAMARAARDRFGLRRVLFVPAASPPHKSGIIASYDDRVRMAELACAGERGFEVSQVERDAVPSYSVVTIERLVAQGLKPLAFLIGADAFAEIRTWHRWRDVVAGVEFLVVTRPGSVYEIPPGAAVFEIDGLDLPVSSSEIREGIARGENDLPIPAAVLDYIRERRIYF